MKKVYIFEIKKLFVLLAVYLGIMTILGAVIVLTIHGITWKVFSILLGGYIIGLVAGTTVISFSYNKKRVSADLNFSLPATKKDLFLGKYLADLTTIFVGIFTYLLICVILYIFADLTLAENGIENSLSYFLKCTVFYIGTTIPLFHFILLFYYKANSILDGVVFVGCGIGILYIVLALLCKWSHIYAPQFLVFLFVEGPIRFLVGDAPVTFGVYYVLCVLLGYAIIIYLILFSMKDCSIRTQEISDGIFGYKVFLPIIGVLLPLTITTTEFEINLIWFILVAIGFFLLYCIYHRSIKFSKLSYIELGSVLLYNFIFYVAISVA